MSGKKNNPGLFYGWLTVCACFAVMLTQGGSMWTFGVFFKPIFQEFSWSRAQISSGYTAFLIGYVISVITTGKLADRYSPRPILLVSAIIIWIGFSLCSQVHTVNQLRIFLFIGGLGGGANWSIPTSTVQRYFFNRQRAGLALGIVISGVGVGAFLFALLANHLVSDHGWRDAYLIIGTLFFVIMTTSSFVVKVDPVETKTVSVDSQSALNQLSIQRWSTRKALTTPSFFVITICHCIAIAAFQIISAHLVPYATDMGISSTASASAIGLMGGFSIPGRILGGHLSEKIQWKTIFVISYLGMGLFILVLLFLQATWMLYCFVLFYGFCHGSRVSAYLGILGDFFGMSSLGELIGITMAAGIFTGSFAPYFAGFLFDITGSYIIVFMIMIVLLLVAGIVASVMTKPDKIY
jgi:MFS family permease